MEKLTFHLADFEGPLDLILHLIAKNKLNIYDIEITLLVEQYLAYIDRAQQEDLEIMSEFLEMAARLVYIKTLMLLPRHDEGEALKQELTGQLLEYQACKAIAGQLASMYKGGDLFVRQMQSIPSDMRYTRTHAPQELVAAYLAVAGKKMRRLPPPAETFSPMIKREYVSVQSRISYVLKRLYQNQKVNFYELFDAHQGRSSMVATFLAVLELLKDNRLRLQESGQQIMLCKNSGGLD